MAEVKLWWKKYQLWTCQNKWTVTLKTLCNRQRPKF